MSDRNQRLPDEDSVARLVRAAGRGPTASDEARARIYRNVHAEWRREVGADERRASRRPGFSWTGALGPWLLRGVPIAAAAAAAIVVVYLSRAPAPAVGMELASVAKVLGTASFVSARDETPTPLDIDGTVIHAGDVVTTGDGSSASLVMSNGLNLRLNSSSEIFMASSEAIELRRGTVYLDSGASTAPDVALEIDTPYGAVWHRGTQYEARLGSNNLRIRVREGEVGFREVNGASREYLGEAGEQLLISESSATPLRSSISVAGPEWAWVENLAAAPSADSYRVIDLLEWIARETGRRLDFRNDAAAARARADTLVGVAGLDPTETLEVIGSTTALRYELTDDGVIVF